MACYNAHMPKKKPTVIIGGDHGGHKLKGIVKKLLKNELGYKVEDVGAKAFDEADDYPDFGAAIAKRVQETGNLGIAFCGSGIGICVVANKFTGVRAGTGYNVSVAEQMRADDDVNVLCLAGRQTTPDHAKAIVKKFLETPFSGVERHKRRLEKVEEIEA